MVFVLNVECRRRVETEITVCKNDAFIVTIVKSHLTIVQLTIETPAHSKAFPSCHQILLGDSAGKLEASCTSYKSHETFNAHTMNT